MELLKFLLNRGLKTLLVLIYIKQHKLMKADQYFISFPFNKNMDSFMKAG